MRPLCQRKLNRPFSPGLRDNRSRTPITGAAASETESLKAPRYDDEKPSHVLVCASSPTNPYEGASIISALSYSIADLTRASRSCPSLSNRSDKYAWAALASLSQRSKASRAKLSMVTVLTTVMDRFPCCNPRALTCSSRIFPCHVRVKSPSRDSKSCD